jgi:hypothetical protein
VCVLVCECSFVCVCVCVCVCVYTIILLHYMMLRGLHLFTQIYNRA